jgi:hypothetical protein
MKLRRVAFALAAMLAAPAAPASILFTPHLSEYADLPRGAYADHTLIYTHITEVFDDSGKAVAAGTPFVPEGQHVDAALLLARYLWIGNVFENTKIPILKDHKQIFRVIATAGWQQASDAITERSRLFDLHTGGNGFGDLFFLAGIYSREHRFGPLKVNGLFAATVKVPVGTYDTKALLNSGTNYWSTIPQIAMHAELFGRLYFDGTVAYQHNGTNDTPAYGGMTPTEPADVYNVEGNLAWKFSEHWFVDFGVFFRKSVGPNRFGKVTATFRDPQPATTLCQNPTGLGLPGIVIPDNICAETDFFRLTPVPGVREDRGIEQTYLSTSLYYVYRSSSVVDLRVSYPISGRGSQFPMEYDVSLYDDPGNTSVSTVATKLNGVQEAASVPASPLFELRFVYLFWAP